MPRATIDDVAALAGVSIKTVSRVANGERNVRQSTREKVQRAIAQLNYRPNFAARNLARQRSHLVVLVYDDPGQYEAPSAGYVIRMQHGALRACRQRRYELLIHPSLYGAADVRRELQDLVGRVRPDGVILAAPLSNMPHAVDAIAETRTPLVCLSPGAVTPGRRAVATNDREICAEMTRYLVSLGHRRIAFVSGNPDHKAVSNRLPGYLDGLRQGGIKHSATLVVAGNNSVKSGEDAAESLLALARPPTAIFAANDDMAAGVLRVALRKGLRVPQDLSVAGFDDSALASHVFPALTTIRQPLARMAERAVQALIGGGDDRGPGTGTVIVPSSLVIRDSTGPAPP
ncbi:MAG: LacI family DNA-binding transcriptional regulator [Steroidobacteraceae bacterium]|jgi:LacI family transcriptional regulator|nr:LacI family DNA-binding transcriptional regulator [Steroidobacteraceae bacterium]